MLACSGMFLGSGSSRLQCSGASLSLRIWWLSKQRRPATVRGVSSLFFIVSTSVLWSAILSTLWSQPICHVASARQQPSLRASSAGQPSADVEQSPLSSDRSGQLTGQPSGEEPTDSATGNRKSLFSSRAGAVHIQGVGRSLNRCAAGHADWGPGDLVLVMAYPFAGNIQFGQGQPSAMGYRSFTFGVACF